MKLSIWKLALPLVALAIPAMSAKADAFFSSEADAAAYCPASEVVWVDLSHGRYYEKSQPGYAKNTSGIFTCEQGALGHGYRKAKEAAE